MRPYSIALEKEKAMEPDWPPMAFVPPSGLDLRATLSKIKIKEEKVKHFFVSLELHYKT